MKRRAGSQPGQRQPWRPPWRSRPGRRPRPRRPGSGAGGSTDPGSPGLGSGRAAATRRPAAEPAASAAGRPPGRDAGGPGEPAAAEPGDSRAGWRCRRPGPAAWTVRRGWQASAHPSLSGSRGVGGGGRSATRHSSAPRAPRRRRRRGRNGSSGYASQSRRPGSRAPPPRPGRGMRAVGSSRIMGSTPDARARCANTWSGGWRGPGSLAAAPVPSLTVAWAPPPLG